MEREELLEMLDDLQHDLGKHLLMPVAMLPSAASSAELRDAATRGLSRIAAWHAFAVGEGATWRGDPYFGRVETSVATASAWASAPALDRARVHADFAAVGEALRAWRRQVADG